MTNAAAVLLSTMLVGDATLPETAAAVVGAAAGPRATVRAAADTSGEIAGVGGVGDRKSVV